MLLQRSRLPSDEIKTEQGRMHCFCCLIFLCFALDLRFGWYGWLLTCIVGVRCTQRRDATHGSRFTLKDSGVHLDRIAIEMTLALGLYIVIWYVDTTELRFWRPQRLIIATTVSRSVS